MTGGGGTPFLLVSGAGNDFIALVDRPAPPARTIRAWCRRGVSVGADGLFSLRREGPGRHVLDYANADGNHAALCLNAARCAARIAFERDPEADRLTLETPAAELVAERVDADRTAVRIAAPEPSRKMTLRANGHDVPGHRIDVGVPHFVLWWSGDLDSAPVASLGPLLRAHRDLGSDGANIHFVCLEPPKRFRIRSFERGVEAETLACGTGAVAAAACAIDDGQLGLPLTAVARSGFPLSIEAVSAAPGHWRLCGDARIVARGRIDEGADARPCPPAQPHTDPSPGKT